MSLRHLVFHEPILSSLDDYILYTLHLFNFSNLWVLHSHISQSYFYHSKLHRHLANYQHTNCNYTPFQLPIRSFAFICYSIFYCRVKCKFDSPSCLSIWNQYNLCLNKLFSYFIGRVDIVWSWNLITESFFYIIEILRLTKSQIVKIER